MRILIADDHRLIVEAVKLKLSWLPTCSSALPWTSPSYAS